jgi:BLOC-1 related complex subunit 6
MKIKIIIILSRIDNFGGVVGSRGSTPNLYRQALMPQVTSVDPNILNDLEAEARKIATSVDTLTENLAGILHSVNKLIGFLLTNLKIT